MIRSALLLLAFLPLLADAQTTPQLSPRAAYDDAMHPLEATRHSIANWSDTEIQALTVAVGRAANECKARDPKSFTGDALIDFVRLCALGQSWSNVVTASGLYITADTPTKPLLNQAYAAKIDAELHLKDKQEALADTVAMLKAVPYDGLVAEVTNEVIEYNQFVDTPIAVSIDSIRQPLLLAKLKATPITPATTPAPSTSPQQSIHDLYADGLAYAALQQLNAKPEDAAATLAALEAALPSPLTPDDAIPIALARKRYAFLGQPLPKIPLTASLRMPTERLPELPAAHALTAILLFPDWCAQCVSMATKSPQSVFLVEGHEAYVYALLAEATPPKPKPPPTKDAPPAKPTPRELLADTPTAIVPPSVLTQFAATDFPFLLLTDLQGIIRVIQPVDEAALQPGGTIDSAIARVATNWPPKPPTEDPKPAPPKPPPATLPSHSIPAPTSLSVPPPTSLSVPTLKSLSIPTLKSLSIPT